MEALLSKRTHQGGAFTRVFSAKGAAFIRAWGSAPGIHWKSKQPALKARFICRNDMRGIDSIPER
jgi:hypothetical protein